MFFEQVVVLRNVLVVEIGDPKIKEDVEQERKVEQNEVLAISSITHHLLHTGLDAQRPKWLDEKVQANENGQVCNELPLHNKGREYKINNQKYKAKKGLFQP